LSVENREGLWDTGSVTREELLALVRRIPDDKISEAEAMLRKLLEGRPPFKPTPLGGLWKGVEITESDIAEARKEMWGNFGERIRA
jgi:hypothetical protein